MKKQPNQQGGTIWPRSFRICSLTSSTEKLLHPRPLPLSVRRDPGSRTSVPPSLHPVTWPSHKLALNPQPESYFRKPEAEIRESCRNYNCSYCCCRCCRCHCCINKGDHPPAALQQFWLTDDITGRKMSTARATGMAAAIELHERERSRFHHRNSVYFPSSVRRQYGVCNLFRLLSSAWRSDLDRRGKIQRKLYQM